LREEHSIDTACVNLLLFSAMHIAELPVLL